MILSTVSQNKWIGYPERVAANSPPRLALCRLRWGEVRFRQNNVLLRRREVLL